MKAKKALAGAVLAGGVLMASAANAWWGPFDWFDDDDDWWDHYPPPWVLYGPYGPYGYWGAPYYYGGYPYAYPYAYPYGGYYQGYTYPSQSTPGSNQQKQQQRR